MNDLTLLDWLHMIYKYHDELIGEIRGEDLLLADIVMSSSKYDVINLGWFYLVFKKGSNVSKEELSKPLDVVLYDVEGDEFPNDDKVKEYLIEKGLLKVYRFG